MTKPIINSTEAEFLPFPGTIPDTAKNKFEGARIAQIGRTLGSQKLGYNVTLLPPGKRAFPFHSHRINEEMFYILEGNGEIRIGNETYPVAKGDFISCLPGGPELAHQIINSSTEELRYIAVSTKLSPEIADYPDSGKFGVLADNFRFVGKAEASLGYWDGE